MSHSFNHPTKSPLHTCIFWSSAYTKPHMWSPRKCTTAFQLPVDCIPRRFADTHMEVDKRNQKPQPGASLPWHQAVPSDQATWELEIQKVEGVDSPDSILQALASWEVDGSQAACSLPSPCLVCRPLQGPTNWHLQVQAGSQGCQRHLFVPVSE